MDKYISKKIVVRCIIKEVRVLARSEKQKLKLLYLIDILKRKTDDDHGMIMNDIIRELSKYEISAERKSLYTDIEALNDFGYDIIKGRENGKYVYKMVSGKMISGESYQLAEIKLLVDAVQSSRFITPKKTGNIIKKLEKEVSMYEAEQLNRSILIKKCSKSENEDILIVIDGIHRAIRNDVQISFKYYNLIVNFKKPNKVEEVARRNDKIYCVSPWRLVWDEEKYYLIAYDSQEDKIKHFRVDKIKHLNDTTEKREGAEKFEDFDVPTYVKRTFKMFGSTQCDNVKLRIDNDIIGIIIDRFGKDFGEDGYNIMKYDDKHSDVTFTVYTSQQFFAWLFGLGDRVKIISPVSVREKYIETLKNTMNVYNDSETL